MSLLHAVYSVAIVLLAVWGLVNLLAVLLRRAEAPLLRRARLLASLCGLLLAAALSLSGIGTVLIAALLGAAGIGCGLAWLYILFKQSLHNTTM